MCSESDQPLEQYGRWISSVLPWVITVWCLSFCSSFVVNQKDVQPHFGKE